MASYEEPSIMLRYVHPENGRYYNIYVQPDMLSQYVIVIARGGYGHRKGAAVRKYGYASQEELELALRDIVVRRERRGYLLKS